MRNRFLIFLLLVSTTAGFSVSSLQQGPESYAGSSVLVSGKWYKIALKEEGIYSISYSALRQMKLVNPGYPKIYGNNYGQLSYFNNDPKPDDLKEIAYVMVTGSDGIFNEGDYILFYAQGVNRWRYNYSEGIYSFLRHNYSDSAYYFITSFDVPGKLAQAATKITEPAVYSSFSYDALFIHEVESENLLHSGREWFQSVSSISSISINPGFTEIIPQEGIRYRFRVLARASVSTLFRLYENETVIDAALVPEVNLFSTTGTYARETIISGTFIPSSSSPSIRIRFFDNGETAARGWLDYIELQGRANTIFSDKVLIFSDSKSVGHANVTEFNIKSNVQAINIWDVTDPFNPEVIEPEKSGDYFRFRRFTDSLRKFIVFSDNQILTPVIKNQPLANQNLHGSDEADMIIVTHPIFLDHAHKLAEIHQNNSGLISIIVTPEQIYNEFSGGIPDAVAIRNFIRMKYIKQSVTSRPLKYLLLFGDGSYDNRKQPPVNPNFVPTYQSLNSTVVTSSFVSDDFYGLLEDDEGEVEGTLDIGIGRIPVFDTSQASVIVSKIIKYIDPSSTGNWRNVIAMIADDEDGNSHMNDAEALSELVESKYPEFNIDKIYLDAFRQITSVNGQSYPDAEMVINNRINTGCLVFNYIGHGNEIGLAHERVVKTQSINSWKNLLRLPLFITATCEFSRFDDAELNIFTGELIAKTSAGEMVLLNPVGGGIALMTTTRVVYSAPNYSLNRNILNYAFESDSTGEAHSLGDIMRLAKNATAGINKRNFLLLGDPALKLACPVNGKIITDSINGKPAATFTDTLKALSYVTISGHIEDSYGQIINDFNGEIFSIVFDKKTRIATLANDGGQKMDFEMFNSIVFNGKTNTRNGRFTFSFVVPRDINYSFGNGKISYFATDSTLNISGYYDRFIIGGFSNLVSGDTTGPVIQLYLNDTLFRNSDIVDNSPILFAIISDESGINTTGSGIGHDITAWLNDSRNNAFILNSFFETAPGSFQKGYIRYPLYNLPEGIHTLTLKAWDNYNNSSSATIKFSVKDGNQFLISNLNNYPNPFSDHTWFSAGHNRYGEDLHVILEIFDMSGRKIKVIEEIITATGYRLPPLLWDGTTENGKKAGRGIYSYVMTIRTEKGESARAAGRLILF